MRWLFSRIASTQFSVKPFQLFTYPKIMLKSSILGLLDWDGGQIALSICIFGMGAIGKFNMVSSKEESTRRKPSNMLRSRIMIKISS
ncbi:hypothetical protein AAHA92_30976 [Salvia divinorum]|uniref:Uncharacterized protein n=1 Tax=Salvia divinorum TaxID=28513 RepID=A0ABD1FV53_SALDI